MVKSTGISLIRQFAWIYAAMFVVIAALRYIPGVVDQESGLLWGLFMLEWHDDLLHLGSGIWAGVAAWMSTRASILYFKLFGIIYGLDGLLGLFTGRGYLDGGIFFESTGGYSLMGQIGANLPHILIGGFAIYIGFLVSAPFVNQD